MVITIAHCVSLLLNARVHRASEGLHYKKLIKTRFKASIRINIGWLFMNRSTVGGIAIIMTIECEADSNLMEQKR